MLNITIEGGHVTSISIDGRCGGQKCLKQLPKSIYQFHYLTEFSLVSTSFDQIPDLRSFRSLKKVSIAYNMFEGPVHLRNLPPSIESLELSRDGIKEVIVDDSLPHLSTFNLIQNRMEGGINPTFCKLPSLNFLDISSGCCLSEAQQTARADAAKRILCNKNIEVSASRSFVD
ncbi:leucine-rich repeat domain-containing protein [Hymenobacter guriensis]|nr:hypothetical protein [Hymenobacter guriensis]